VSITTERDGAVEGDNSVELTIAPTEDLSSFFRFATNTLGTLYDEHAGNKEWNGEWTVAVQRQEKSWTVEFSIPWSAVSSRPELNAYWGLGVGRVEGPYAEYSNWAVVNGDYSQRERHGQIAFATQADMPYVVVENPERFALGYNRLSGQVVRPASPEATYTVRYQQWEQISGQPSREVDLAARSVSGASSSFEFEVAIDRPGTYLLTFTLLSGSDVLYRTTLGYHVRAVQAERFALEPKQPIYTWEDEARFYLSVDTMTENLSELTAVTEIYKKTGQIVRVNKGPVSAAHHVIRVPIGDLPDETYRADISVMRSEEPGASWSVMFERRSSVPAPPAVATQEDRTIYVGDQPLFPLGMFEVPDIAELAEAGFNVVIDRDVPDFSQEREMTLYLDRCKELGLWAILKVETCLLPEINREGLREAVCRVKDHPALLGYLLLDNPGSAGIEPGYLDTARAIIRDIDRFHPVIVREETPVMFPGYADTCDVFVATCNPVPFSSLAVTGSIMDRAWQASKGRRSVLACLQAFGPPAVPRHPTFKESRAMAWMALIHNAKGLFWWSCQEAKRSGHWEDLKRLARELKPIIPSILSGVPGEILVSESSPNVCLRSWALEGKTLVLAVNTEPQSGSIHIEGASDQVTDLMGGKPPIEPSRGGDPAQILLEPFGVAAFVLPADRP
ncbi:MAG: hypothetical protein ABIH23_00170, partial [bacterium]